MKRYIFLTDGGYTFQPGSESIEPDVENLQVLGIVDGDTPEHAFDNLIAENPWLKASSFTSTFCYEVNYIENKSFGIF